MSQQSERYVAYVLSAGCTLSSALLAYVRANKLPVELKYVDFKEHVSCAPCLHDHATGRFLNVADTVHRIKAMAKSTAEPDCTLYVHPDSPTSNKLLEYILATDLEIEVHDVQYLDYVRAVPALEDTELQLLYVAGDAVEACASLLPRADDDGDGGAGRGGGGGADGGGNGNGNAAQHEMDPCEDPCDGDFCPVGGGASRSLVDLGADDRAMGDHAGHGPVAEPDGPDRSEHAGATTEGVAPTTGGCDGPRGVHTRHETAPPKSGSAVREADTPEAGTATPATGGPHEGTAATPNGATATGEADIHGGATREVRFPPQSTAVVHIEQGAQTTATGLSGSAVSGLACGVCVPSTVVGRRVSARRPAVEAQALANVRDGMVPKLSSAPSTPRSTVVP